MRTKFLIGYLMERHHSEEQGVHGYMDTRSTMHPTNTGWEAVDWIHLCEISGSHGDGYEDDCLPECWAV
jgi:hypothetical protein